jgi:hypothetical protein
MHRRDALRLLVTTAVPALAGLSPARLGAVGRSAHRTGRALQVLDAHQSATVLAIAEHIIPATDTPGARAARVDAFADVILAERYDDRERARFLAGLADVDARARATTGRSFLEATAEQQVAVLTALDAAALAARARDPSSQPFFREMKWLTLYGYYTSEIGVTEELRQSVIPGRYDPCIPVAIDRPGGS